jgi:formylglycine-generating enzyme required for sulfatase activity
LSGYAWFFGKSGETTHPVGQKQPNAWGLYDMHGNVGEWVQDCYGERYYSSSASTDPTGPASGPARVVRGGSWNSSAKNCRSAFRDFIPVGYRNGNIGFRLALSPE